MIKYWILLSSLPRRYRYLLFSLRTFLILWLLLLLINPFVDWKKNEQKPQNISVIFDLSESMFSHFENYPLQYDKIRKKIKTWGDEHDLNMNYFRLGQRIGKLDVNNMEYADLITDFMNIPDFISLERSKQILLITDGKATVGKNINEIEFSQLHPIHTVGIGPLQVDQDIAIQDVILPDLLILGDTVNVKIRIQTHIQEDVHCNFQIINVFGKRIYYERILIEKGNRLKELILKIPADTLKGLNVASISPINGEIQIENNTFSFRGNSQDSVDDILLITGALSQNTRIIRGLLDEIVNTHIHHLFRMDPIRWNEEPLLMKYSNLKMIVLDDYPMHNEDSQLFQKIVALSKNQQIPIMYLQGPGCNLTACDIIHSAYPDFLPKAVNSTLPMDISTQSSWLGNSGIDLAQLPPQKRYVKWISSDKPWISYVDESVLIGNNNTFYLVSFPALAESHFKISMNSESIVSQLLQKVLLHAFYGNEGLLSLDVDGRFFNKGEIVQLSLGSVNGIDLMDLSVMAVHNKDTLQLECTKEEWDDTMRCSKELLLPGEYTFYAEALLSSGKKVYSSKKLAIVQGVKVEMKELKQERHALMEISYKTGGTYTSIDSLDTMLANIDITPVQWVNNHQISGLSSQNYWWILLLLLSIEWYFRKKLGLL